MKKYFCETNGYNLVVYVDDNKKGVWFDCETIEDAENMDESGIIGEETAEAIADYCSIYDRVFDFSEDNEGFENVFELSCAW